MSKIIIPIGMALGAYHDDDGEFLRFEHLIGDEVEEFDVHDWGIWWTTHDDHEAHLNLEFDRRALLKAVRVVNEETSEELINERTDRLIEAGALVELEFTGNALEAFFKRYNVMPTGRCFGNSDREPTEYLLGRPSQPEAGVSGWAQMIWAASHRDGSIWKGCEVVASQDTDATPAEVAEDFANILPFLVAKELAYLEPV